MSRRKAAPKRKILPDPKFGNLKVAKFMNQIMTDGKKSVAEKIIYGAFDEISKKSDKEPVEVFEKALEELEELVSSMEDGKLSLEDSLQAFEKGIKLTRECQTALKKAEQKVQVLINENGDTEELEFEDDE